MTNLVVAPASYGLAMGGYIQAFYLLFLLAKPSQDVFLLPLIPWIEQGGIVYLLHFDLRDCLAILI